MKIHTLLVPALLAAAVLTGCTTNRQPRYNVKAPLEVKPFKRLTKDDSVDFVFRWRKGAYTKVESPITRRLSATQKDALARHGQPDYRRNGVRSVNGEQFDEWAWWDRSIVCQFVERELVYEGPLTDMDRARITYGYPARAWAQKYPDGVQRDFWEYQGILFDKEAMLLTFSGEKLVSEQRY